MRRYFEPAQCADCGAATGSQARCPACGLLQAGQVADDLRETLQRADQILDVLRRVSVPAPAPAAAPAAGPAAPAPAAPAPVRARSAAAPARRRGLPAVSVPVVLLGLGTICVLVAAIVFVSVTWTDLSLAWRTTILLAITALGAAAAVWAVRRGLRVAAEALTLVASGLLLIDLLAGNTAGLPVLSALQGNAFGWLVALVMLVTGIGWAVWAQRTATRSLVGAQVVAALALLVMAGLAVDGWDHGLDWLGAVMAVAAAAAGLVLVPLRVHVVAVTAAVLSVLSWLLLAALGLLRAIDTTSAAELWLELDAAPLLVASALMGVVAGSARPRPSVRAVAASLAVAGPVLVALLPARHLNFTPAVVVVAGAALVLVVVALLLPAPWRGAGRTVGLGTAVLPTYVWAYAAVVGVVRALETADPFWDGAAGDPLSSRFVAGPGQAWVYLPLGALLGATLAAALLRRTRTCLAWAAVGTGVGALTSLLATGWTVGTVGLLLALGSAAAIVGYARSGHHLWLAAVGTPTALGLAVAASSVVATSLLFPVHGFMLLVLARLIRQPLARGVLTGGGVVLLAVALEAFCSRGELSVPARGLALLLFAAAAAALAQWFSRRPDGAPWRVGLESAAALLAVLALGQTVGDQAVHTVALGVVVLVTAGIAVVSRDRRLLACVATAFLAGTAHQVVQLAGGAVEWRAVAAVAVAASAALGAQALARPGTRDLLRVALEATAGLVALVSLSGQLGDSLALSVGLSILGGGAVLVSFVSADRRRVAWLGGALLVLASWVRLYALDVDVVEAYTLPGALALFVAGVVWMLRTPGATSWQALAAPLGLGVGPSLAVALEAPTSLRALLVGVAGLVLLGAALRLRWGAPLLVGGVTVALLALVNIAPYAAGLPRWVLFGGAGVALLALGVTWDQRRHDVAVAHRYATRLR